MSQSRELAREIGVAFRAHREARGLRQDDVARAAREGGVNWTRATIAAIETGKRELSLREFFMLRGTPLQKDELDGKRGLFWYATQDKPIRRGTPAEQLDAEMKAAEKLGVEANVVVAASYRLWGRTLTEERDRIARARMSMDEKAEEYYSDATLTPRSLQAHRGHITRELVTQIEQLLLDPSFDSRDKYGWRRAFESARKK